MTEIKTVQNFYMTTNSLSLYMTATGRELPLCPPSLSLALLDVFILRPMPTRQHMHALHTSMHAHTHSHRQSLHVTHSHHTIIQNTGNNTQATIPRTSMLQYYQTNSLQSWTPMLTPAARHITGVQRLNRMDLPQAFVSCLLLKQPWKEGTMSQPRSISEKSPK